jgi:signal transduction histidine kinase
MENSVTSESMGAQPARSEPPATVYESRRLLRFLRKLPHDFANAVLPFQIAADLMRRADGDPATLQQVQQLLEAQSAQAQRLVDDLERTVRVLRGHVDIRPEPCDLVQVVENGIKAARTAAAPSVQLERAYAQTPVELEADPRLLAAAVEELVDNAARFAGMHPIRIEAERAGDHAVVRVCDQGPGLHEALADSVFEPFVAAETVESGWGIGLGFVRLVAAAHGGTIAAAPGPGGRGVTMTLRVPLRPPSIDAP